MLLIKVKIHAKDLKIRMGQISSNTTNAEPLYVVDGILPAKLNRY